VEKDDEKDRAALGNVNPLLPLRLEELGVGTLHISTVANK
jgi:hypothetical protein